mgnify:CR=1 FL=1
MFILQSRAVSRMISYRTDGGILRKKLILKISSSYKVSLGEFKSASLELLNETGHPRKVALLI